MALALDGSNSGSATVSALTLALTTTKSSGLICAACGTFNAAGPIISVTGSGLSFVRRTAIIDGSGNCNSNWYAPYISNFSGNIVITQTNVGTGTVTAAVFGIFGTQRTVEGASFDRDSPRTDILGNGAMSITTANANDFVFTNYLGGSMTVGAGWTSIATGTQLVEYQILASTQTVTGTFAAGFMNSGIIDAVIASTAVRTGGICL